MRNLRKLLTHLAIPNLTAYLIAAQVAAYLFSLNQPALADRLTLVPAAVFGGDAWRLLTMLAIPPFTNPLFAIFFWWLFFMMGSALESFWGTGRYNLYLFTGYAATVAAAFLTPQAATGNGFLYGSVFLAFAWLYPDFELAIFFVLPVKIKWLALLAWIGYALALAGGDTATRLATVAAVANFLLFFGKDLYYTARGVQRRMEQSARQSVAQQQPFHRCRVCGITDQSHPNVEFRYCSKCAGACGYCPEHLQNHEHLL